MHCLVHRHPELTEQTIWEVFEAERPKLIPYRGRFDGFHAVPASISKTCLERFDNNKHSVAVIAVGRPVEVGSHRNPPGLAHCRRTSPWFDWGDTAYDPRRYVRVTTSELKFQIRHR